jgi:predicted RNA-binding Zn ribbon-like protein
VDFLFIDFLNSEWRDGIHDDSYIDRLDDTKWMNELLTSWELTINEDMTEEKIKRLITLRALLRKLVIDLTHKQQLTDNDVNQLNDYLYCSLFLREIRNESGILCLTEKPVNPDWNWVMAKIVQSFAHLLSNHQIGRLKICKNEKCGWVFFDVSKNRSRVWCYHSNCGNLMNVRKHRERKQKK